MSSESYNLTFAGTSFMGVYNIGSAVCMLDHGKNLVRKVKYYGGTSAGAITACIMLSAPERLSVSLKCFLSRFVHFTVLARHHYIRPVHDLMRAQCHALPVHVDR